MWIYVFSYYFCFVVVGFILIVIIIVLVIVDGLYEYYVRKVIVYVRFVVWWIGFGVVLLIGFGFGFYMFVLYFGLYIVMFVMKVV